MSLTAHVPAKGCHDIPRFACHVEAHPAPSYAGVGVRKLGALLLAVANRRTPPAPAGKKVETLMPFQVQGAEALTDKIAVRLTPAEKAKLREDADLAGLSVSELVRRRYFGRRIVHHADLKTAAELRKTAGLLKDHYNQTRGLHADKTAAILSDIWALVRRLGGDRQEN